VEYYFSQFTCRTAAGTSGNGYGSGSVITADAGLDIRCAAVSSCAGRNGWGGAGGDEVVG